MRHRSLTNSRAAEDLDFRQSYRDRVFYDELLPYFPVDGPGYVKIPGVTGRWSMHGTDATEIHHAFGGRAGRWDRVWNIVHLHPETHVWCEAFKTDGRVLVIRRKVDAGQWDEADAFACLGMHPLGWIQGVTCEHPFAEAIRVEIVRQIREGKLL